MHKKASLWSPLFWKDCKKEAQTKETWQKNKKQRGAVAIISSSCVVSGTPTGTLSANWLSLSATSSRVSWVWATIHLTLWCVLGGAQGSALKEANFQALSELEKLPPSLWEVGVPSPKVGHMWEIQLPMEKLVSVTTDEASAMTGRWSWACSLYTYRERMMCLHLGPWKGQQKSILK